MNKPFNALLLAAAALALQAVPALAAQMQEEVPVAAVNATVHGLVQKGSTDTVLRVNGRAYTISPTTTVVYSAGGARVGAPRLTEGRSVAFNLASGSVTQIKELWIDV